jgi:hypothetical protein
MWQYLQWEMLCKRKLKKKKYMSLCVEIQWMWNLKCKIVPVVIWATGKVTKGLRKKFGSHTRKTFNRFTNKDSCTGNITHNTDSTAVWNLKPERWGSLLVQENYQEENTCDKRQKQQQQHNNNNNNNNNRSLVFNWPITLNHFTDNFTWQQAEHWSLLFQFTISWSIMPLFFRDC